MIPKIDPNVRYVGSSWLRGLNVETMKSLTGAVVVQDGDATAMIVILPYETYLAIQQAVRVNMEVASWERSGTGELRPLWVERERHDTPEMESFVREQIEQAPIVDNRPKSAVDAGDRHVMPIATPKDMVGQVERSRMNVERPKNAYCKHCGSRFAGQKFATICPECKSSGHTNQPAECPRCTEASAI